MASRRAGGQVRWAGRWAGEQAERSQQKGKGKERIKCERVRVSSDLWFEHICTDLLAVL
jgi:hypothetical protein